VTTHPEGETWKNYHPSWSPNGQQIVFESDRVAWAIYKVPVTGGTGTYICGHSGDDGDPVWFPGPRIAHHSQQSGSFDIWVMDEDCTGLVQVTSWPENEYGCAWSYDHTLIAYDRYAGDGDIWICNAAGGGDIQVTSIAGAQIEPTWSPDGGSLAYQTNENGTYDINVCAAVAGGGSSAVPLSANPDADETLPCWSPDGEWIAFAADLAGNYDIWIISASGGTPIQVTTDPGYDSNPSWSPDGSSIAFESNRTGLWEIWIATNPGTAAQPSRWGSIKAMYE
jgi:TolB protein